MFKLDLFIWSLQPFNGQTAASDFIGLYFVFILLSAATGNKQATFEKATKGSMASSSL